jgi:hypothetical protein
MLMELNERGLLEYVAHLEEENGFLKVRNSELRQKSYIQVYDENLKMIDEIKALKHENQVKFNDLVKYEKTIEQLRTQLAESAIIADRFYQDYLQLEKENQQLKGVVDSVQTFINQFT